MSTSEVASITFSLATAEDAEAITSLSKRAQEALLCRDFFVVSGCDRIRWKLANNAFAYLARVDGELAGYYLFEMPGLDPDENPGFDIDLPQDELEQVL